MHITLLPRAMLWLVCLSLCVYEGCWRQECRFPACVWYQPSLAQGPPGPALQVPQMPGEPGREQETALPMLSEKHVTPVSSNYREKMNHIPSLCPWWRSGCWKAAVSRSSSSLLPAPLSFQQLHLRFPEVENHILSVCFD